MSKKEIQREYTKTLVKKLFFIYLPPFVKLMGLFLPQNYELALERLHIVAS
jgi:hypothetical protein